MAVPKTTETRCRDGMQCAGKTCYTHTTQVTPSLHLFLLQTAILNNLMAGIASKIISGIKKDVVFVQHVLPARCHPYTSFLWFLAQPSLPSFNIFNPRRACAARATVLVLCVCVSVSPSVRQG